MKVELIDAMSGDLTVVNAARQSFARSSEEMQAKDIKLLGYLAEHKHMGPFEHTGIIMAIECPIYIARQIMRHRTFSYSEVSRRYTSRGMSVHAPAKGAYRKQAEDNKQASAGLLSDEDQVLADACTRNAYESALQAYKKLRDLGVAREQARGVLPQAANTNFWMTGNLRNWCHFLRLRLGADAQPEVREIAEAVKVRLEMLFPHSMGVLLKQRVTEED